MQKMYKSAANAAAIFMVLLLSSTMLVIACGADALADSNIGQRMYDRAQFIFDHATEVRYEHHKVPAKEQVEFNGDNCRVNADCSGFVSYILREIAPKHYAPIKEMQPDRPYPQAKTYASFFRQLSSESPHNGWIRIRNYRDLQRGDIIAWSKGNSGTPTADRPRKHGNTGHVMIVAEAAGQPAEKTIEGKTIRYVDVAVIDASSVDHFSPEALPPLAHQQHRDGLGKGRIRLILGDNDRTIGYWEGTYWNEGQRELNHPSYSDDVEFARVMPLHEK